MSSFAVNRGISPSIFIGSYTQNLRLRQPGDEGDLSELALGGMHSDFSARDKEEEDTSPVNTTEDLSSRVSEAIAIPKAASNGGQVEETKKTLSLVSHAVVEKTADTKSKATEQVAKSAAKKFPLAQRSRNDEFDLAGKVNENNGASKGRWEPASFEGGYPFGLITPTTSRPMPIEPRGGMQFQGEMQVINDNFIITGDGSLRNQQIAAARHREGTLFRKEIEGVEDAFEGTIDFKSELAEQAYIKQNEILGRQWEHNVMGGKIAGVRAKIQANWKPPREDKE